MDQEKFNALIRLMDDPDPIVAETVEKEMFALGMQGVEWLEEAWERAESEVLQSKIEETIQRIQTAHFTRKLLDWRLAGGENLFEGWWILTQIQYPTLNPAPLQNELKRMAHKIWLNLDPYMTDVEKLVVVNKHVYQLNHFSGNYGDDDNPDYNFLKTVIETKRSNSLGLAAFYYGLCNELGISLQLVNFQGYYALRYYSRDSHFYIDTYNNGAFFSPENVVQFLKKIHAEPDPSYYKPLSNIYIVLQLIRQLADGYKSSKPEKAEVFERLLKDIEIKLPGSTLL
jgi:regulator of sirC expression with transglutaminase-like and TPR domain